MGEIAKCSKDSAVRDINDLIEKGILQKEAAEVEVQITNWWSQVFNATR
jgi:Fic family protein